MNFKHFIITRFNLRIFNSEGKRQEKDWLCDRFMLFETYCLPSVKAQTCKNFTWLCLFDDQTPSEYRMMIDTFVKDCPQMMPIYYSEAETAELFRSLRNTIMGLAGPDVDYIVTTNLDNDDSLSIRMVDILQSKLDLGSDKEVYSFVYGYQYFVNMNFVLKMKYPNNHFLTLVERNDGNIETIISFRHARVGKHLNISYIDDAKGMWLEIVHGGNLSNNLNINSHVKNVPVMGGFSLVDFGIVVSISSVRQVVNNIFILPFKFICVGARRLKGKRARMKDKHNWKATN